MFALNLHRLHSKETLDQNINEAKRIAIAVVHGLEACSHRRGGCIRSGRRPGSLGLRIVSLRRAMDVVRHQMVVYCNLLGKPKLTTDPTFVEELRAVSRKMVRALGFMGGDFAGTRLSPSAVHALIEIEQGGLTARDLGARLHLEKSSVSRMLQKLAVSGDVQASAGPTDGRVKKLSLTGQGKKRVAAIHAFARAQVSGATGRLAPGQDRVVLQGLRLYADALESHANKHMSAPNIDIRSGYQTGLIARITQMHALFYARNAGFGQRFESVVAGGLAEFCNRLASPHNGIWVAMAGDQIVGSVAIDGEDLGTGIAHLRWFIVDDGLRGGGVGRRLLAAALAFVDAHAFAETHLWTFSGLAAARRLYEALGFVCVEAWTGTQWGDEVLEQRFVRRHA